MTSGPSSYASRRPRALSVPRVLAVLGLAAVAAGCSSDVPKDLTGLTVDDRSGGGWSQPDALVEGRLVEIDGCVYLEDDLGTRFVLSFPRGAAERTTSGIRVKGHDHAIGDRYSVAGQTFTPPHSFTAPASCETGTVWMAFP